MNRKVHVGGERLREVAEALAQAGWEVVETPEGAVPLLDARDVAAAMRKMVHDLRTPLNAIAGYGEMLLEEQDPIVRQRFASNILKAADRLDQQLRAAVDSSGS